MRLVNRAIKEDKKRRHAIENHLPLPPKNNQLYHIMFGCSNAYRKQKTARVQHRKKLGLKVGDTRQVHHTDKHMSLKGAKVLTFCEHKKRHGQKCGQ